MSAERPSKADVVLAIVNAVAALAYPVVVWIGLTTLGTRAVSVLVLALLVPMLAIRLRKADRATFWSIVRVPVAILVLVVVGAVTEDARFVLAMPVVINVVLLATFGETLRAGQTPMIERFARMQDPDLDPARCAHCRQFTWVWSVFFLCNGATAAALALAAPLSFWATYTGLVAYVLMGVLFTVEYVIRKARFRDYGSGPHDRLLARLFPPPAVRDRP